MTKLLLKRKIMTEHNKEKSKSTSIKRKPDSKPQHIKTYCIYISEKVIAFIFINSELLSRK